jgi:hypothetical protein
MKRRCLALALACLLVPPGLIVGFPAHAEPSLTGQTGLIYMPDARLDPDGTWRTGYSRAEPYGAVWISLTALPRLEVRCVLPKSTACRHSGASRARITALQGQVVRRQIPADRGGRFLAGGGARGQDLFGTEVFRAGYVTLGKQLGDFDFTLGYGTERIDGGFGGLRYRPRWLKGWGLVAEYDAYDYSRDIGSAITGVDQRQKDVVGGIEYRYGWLGLQANYGHDEAGVNAHITVPLQQKDFVPDIDEPEPYVKITPRPRAGPVEPRPTHRHRMIQALLRGTSEREHRHRRRAHQRVLTNTRISDAEPGGRTGRTHHRAARADRDTRDSHYLHAQRHSVRHLHFHRRARAAALL